MGSICTSMEIQQMGVYPNKTRAQFNPNKLTHCAPEVEICHAGDPGNIVANADGVAEATIVDKQVMLVLDFVYALKWYSLGLASPLAIGQLFSKGFVTDEEVTRRESILRDALKNDPQFQVIEGASVEVAKYNPPFTLPFTHHNDVALEVERKSE